MDAFVSWTLSDEDVKNVIVKRLQAEGITCFDSDENCVSTFAKECIQNLRRCGLYIIIVSDASMARGYVKNEMYEAKRLEDEGKLNILVYKITDSPYNEDFVLNLNHISFLTGNLIERKESVTGDSSMDKLIKRALLLLQMRKDGEPEKPFQVKVPQINGLQITKAGYFVDNSRDALLTAIDEGFQGSNVLILKEFVGFGKRSTIKKYVELHKSQCVTAVLVSNTQGSLREFLLGGLEFTNLNPALFDALEGDALIDAKLKILQKLDEKTLLVIPDVTFDSQPDPDLCQKLLGLKCRIILLTQESADLYADWFPVLRVGRMENQHLLTLFFHHYTRAFEDEQEQLHESLTVFFDNIGGHTKTVELTASVLNREKGALPEEVPAYLSMQGMAGLQLKDRILQQLSNVFDLEQLAPEQITALVVAASLAVPYLSEKHYRNVLRNCGCTDWQTVLELDRRRWLDLDPHNRTVSMEPLVAQIILSKFPEEYQTLVQCLDDLQDSLMRTYRVTASPEAAFRILSRLQHFCRLTELPELTQLVEAVKQYNADNTSYDPQAVGLAVQQFELRFPADRYGIVEDFPDDHVYTREDFVCAAQSLVRSVLLPLAKVASSQVGSLLTDFSSASSRLMMEQFQNFDTSLIDIQSLFGMSQTEFREWLDSIRTYVAVGGELDADDLESVFLAEAINMLDSLYRRDPGDALISAGNLLQYIEDAPQLMASETCADLVFSAFYALGEVYLKSQAYGAAILLCRRALDIPCDALSRTRVLQCYITALHRSGQYTPELYDAYQELLRDFDKKTAEVFDKREEMLREKKYWLLLYAYDLACGQLLEEAEETFAAAQKLHPVLQPDGVVTTAHTIAEVWIKSGAFSQALAFIRRHFPPRMLAQFASLCNPENREYLENFADYQAADSMEADAFSAETQPENRGYYRDQSRKNNPFLERKYAAIAERAAAFDFSGLTDQQLTEHAATLRQRARQESIQRLAPEAFALASEAGFRVLGYRHHKVQFMGAAAMADGKIAEIFNGEGKTYTIVLTAFLHSLYGKQVYVVDESEQLTQRNQLWMQGVYRLLGLTCRYAPTEWDALNRRSDVLYLTLRSLIFAYQMLELDLKHSRQELPLDCVIIDEADTVLVDSALTSYVVPSEKSRRIPASWFHAAWQLAQEVAFDEEYYTTQNNNCVFSTGMYPLLEARYGLSWSDLKLLPQTRAIEQLVRTAIECCNHMEENKHYFIHKNRPMQESRNRGVFIPFREDYEYFLRLRCGLPTGALLERLMEQPAYRNLICVRDLFRKFRTVCGTTATASSFRKEFRDIYDLEYVAIPPHLPCIRDDQYPPIYFHAADRDQAILETVRQKHSTGQPILLVTQSIEDSERFSRLLTRAGIQHQLLNARNADASDDMIALAGIPGSVLVANALAGRGVDIKLGGDPQLLTRRELVSMGADISKLDSFLYTLPTPQQQESSLYKQYFSILEKYRLLVAKDRQTVLEAGGLCVIGTSFFQEPRNEQQTRGRSGRQGQPGESMVFISLEDPALQSFVNPGYFAWLERKFPDMDAVDSLPLLNKAIRTAQAALHDLHFSNIRKVNLDSTHIDRARTEFMELRFALTERQLTLEQLIDRWAAAPGVLQQLSSLQEGKDQAGDLVKLLFAEYEPLKTVKGKKASPVLAEALHAHFAKRLPGLDYLAEHNQRPLLDQLTPHLLDAWEEYVTLVYETVGQVSLQEQTLDSYLDTQKNRLLWKLMEPLIHVRLSSQQNAN